VGKTTHKALHESSKKKKRKKKDQPRQVKLVREESPPFSPQSPLKLLIKNQASKKGFFTAYSQSPISSKQASEKLFSFSQSPLIFFHFFKRKSPGRP